MLMEVCSCPHRQWASGPLPDGKSYAVVTFFLSMRDCAAEQTRNHYSALLAWPFREEIPSADQPHHRSARNMFSAICRSSTQSTKPAVPPCGPEEPGDDDISAPEKFATALQRTQSDPRDFKHRRQHGRSPVRVASVAGRPNACATRCGSEISSTFSWPFSSAILCASCRPFP